MKFDFDGVIDRTQSDSTKWTATEQVFGVKDVLPMWVADMDFQAPPAVVEALVKRAQHGVFGYPYRHASYFESIIGWMSKRHGWEIRRDWIVSVPGVVNGLDLAVQALTHPGDKLIVQPPVYYPFFSTIKNNGRQMVVNRLKADHGYYRMDLEDLEKQIDSRTKVLILCSPHNPVGRVWDQRELEELGDLCARKNLLIFSDEIHSDLVFPGHKHTPLATLSKELAARTLTFVAPSKTFNVPGLCAATVIISDRALRTSFSTTLENFGLLGNVFGIAGLEAAYREGEEWLVQLLEYLAKNVSYATRFIEQRIPRIKATCPEGTYLLWLDCRDLGLDNAGLKNFMLKQARVALNDGPEFGAGGEGFQRMNVGCPRSVLKEGLERIERAVNARA